MTSIPWNRINTGLLLLVLLAIIGLFASRAYGGPLDPPVAPASTDGVREPGTPISALPFTADSPGRYYLTRHLSAASGNGVTIQASNVSLDLNGFTLIGSPGGVNGVFVSGPQHDVRIENGTVRNWFNGIDASAATNVTISNVTAAVNGGVAGDGSYGILVGAFSVIDDCIVRQNANSGVFLDGPSVIRRCMIASNAQGVVATSRTLVEDNWIVGNGSSVAYAGIYVPGSNVTIRGNSLSQDRDILLATNPATMFTIIVDNTLFTCTSIVNSTVSSTNFLPRDGTEHSNVAAGANYC